jgi:hypothetical protein
MPKEVLAENIVRKVGKILTMEFRLPLRACWREVRCLQLGATFARKIVLVFLREAFEYEYRRFLG